MKRHCIYKIKEESKDLFSELFSSEYVVVEEFAHNPLIENNVTHCVFKYIHIDTMDYTSHITGYRMLPCKEFEKHFELFMDTNQINDKLRELDLQR